MKTSAGHRNLGALRLVWAFTLGTFLSACYRQVPVAQPAQLAAGAVVRIQLSLAGTQALERVLGPEIRFVSGKVETATSDTLFISLQESRTLTGQVLPSTGTRVAIPRAYIADLSERVQNKRRSVLASIGAVVAAILIIVAASGALGGGGTDGTTPPPPPPA